MFDNVSPAVKTLLSIGAAAAVTYSVATIFRWQKRKKYEYVGKVRSLFLYPIKSCKGISVTSGQCCHLGLCVDGVSDRHWLVVRPNGDFLTQRQEPKMALITVSMKGDVLQLEAPGMETRPTISINPTFEKSNVKNCRVFTDRLEGLDCGDEAAEWLNKYLEIPGLRLLFLAKQLGKKDITKKGRSWDTQALPGDESAYSDFCGYMLLSHGSMEALNNRLDKPLTPFSFRPNIYVEGTEAFDECNWEEVRIGDKATFRCLDDCTRCILTTVNPDTGVKDPDEEPLKTLRTFRSFPKYGAAPAFGRNMTLDVAGDVKVGDPVYAIRKQS